MCPPEPIKPKGSCARRHAIAAKSGLFILDVYLTESDRQPLRNRSTMF